MASITAKKAKNIAKELRLARATEGSESEKHFNNVDRLVEKYGIIIPDSVQREKFDLATMASIQRAAFPSKKKVFYKYYEWSGWRFYLKAIRHGDWRSIREHIKDIYFK